MNFYRQNRYVFILLAFTLYPGTFSGNDDLQIGPSPIEKVSVSVSISSTYYPVILRGSDIAPLLGSRVGRIQLMRVANDVPVLIPFQIDRRDRDSHFELPVTEHERKTEGDQLLDENDELVFMAIDLGERSSAAVSRLQYASVIEIAITDPRTGDAGWIYAIVGLREPSMAPTNGYVRYIGEDDAVEADTYRVGFSRKLPFLVESLHWRNRENDGFGPNLVHSMKILHEGLLFKRFHFVRTDEDYSSRIVGIKEGPVRIIRRTANRVRMAFGIRSPAVAVDYLIYPAAFTMDIIVDFPFRIGLLFDKVNAIPSIRLADSLWPDGIRIRGKSAIFDPTSEIEIDEQRKAFNQSGDGSFIIEVEGGGIAVDMALESDSPIKSRVHLRRLRSRTDAGGGPENLYGMPGFLMTDWEKLDSQTHHILFRTYMLPIDPAQNGLSILDQAPTPRN